MSSLWDEAKNLERLERRLDKVEAGMCRYADALIWIASVFVHRDEGTGLPLACSLCAWCRMPVDLPCRVTCPGLLARRALGVA